jgi:hypothetical protein
MILVIQGWTTRPFICTLIFLSFIFSRWFGRWVRSPEGSQVSVFFVNLNTGVVGVRHAWPVYRGLSRFSGPNHPWLPALSDQTNKSVRPACMPAYQQNRAIAIPPLQAHNFPFIKSGNIAYQNREIANHTEQTDYTLPYYHIIPYPAYLRINDWCFAKRLSKLICLGDCSSFRENITELSG